MQKRYVGLFLTLALLLFVVGCSSTTVQRGDFVSVNYIGTLPDGAVFDQSEQPLTFTVGAQEVLPAFEEAILGLEVGEQTEITLLPADAYGEFDPALIVEYPREQLPQDQEPVEGMSVRLTSPEGQQYAAIIQAVGNETVTLDFNHPLAGQTLHFAITVVSIA